MFPVAFAIRLKTILENWVMFSLEPEISLMINISITFVLKSGPRTKKHEIEKYILNAILHGFEIISKQNIEI